MSFGKPSRMQAEFTARMDELELTIACGICGDFAIHAPFREARQAAADHRAQTHPELRQKRRARGRPRTDTCEEPGCAYLASATHGPTAGLCRLHADQLRRAKLIRSPAA